MANILQIEETIFEDGNSYVKIVQVLVKLESTIITGGNETTRLELESSEFFKRSFYSFLSRNGKQIIGYFTLDGFNSATIPLDARIYLNEQVIVDFSGIDLSSIIELAPFITPGTYSDGDESWLSNFYS
jgi:hypothetical protein